MWNAFKLIDVSSCLVVCLSIVIHFKSENDGQSREGKIVANFMMPDLYLFFFCKFGQQSQNHWPNGINANDETITSLFLMKVFFLVFFLWSTRTTTTKNTTTKSISLSSSSSSVSITSSKQQQKTQTNYITWWSFWAVAIKF